MTDIEIRTNIMNALIECRKEKALTQEQVASAFEVKPTTVASYQGFTSHYKTLMTRNITRIVRIFRQLKNGAADT